MRILSDGTLNHQPHVHLTYLAILCDLFWDGEHVTLLMVVGDLQKEGSFVGVTATIHKLW